MTDGQCIDISAELIEVIEQSWARERRAAPAVPNLRQDGLSLGSGSGVRACQSFVSCQSLAAGFFDYQVAAVKIAAHHLNKRHGVLIGDVVGLGKTLMATALAKIFQDDYFTETLIICPKNLVKMWEDYVAEYRLLAVKSSPSQKRPESFLRYAVTVLF